MVSARFQIEPAINRPCARVRHDQPVKRVVVPLAALVLIAGCNAVPPGNDTNGNSYVIPAPVLPLPTLPSASPIEPSPTPPRTLGPCPPSGVQLEAGPTDGAAGLRALGIDLINCSHKTYKVDGYAVVHVLDKDHKALAIKVLHGTKEIAGPVPDWNGPPKPIVLKPGRRATCVVVWRSTYDDIRQPPVNAPYLEMAPASGRPAEILTADGPLDLGSTGRLGVSPWRPSKAAAPTASTTPPPVP
jgi:hypothetical protein